jgi:uncharacterized membrane protein YqjE
MAEQPSAGAPAGSGLVGSAKSMLSTAIAAVETRLELLGTEVQEERMRLTRLVLWGTAGLFCLFLGITLLAVFLVVLFWDSNRLAVLGLLAGLFLGAGLVIGIGTAVIARAPRPPPLAATRDVLARDRKSLESGS